MGERFEIFTALIAKISRNIRKIKNQTMAEYHLRNAHVTCLYYLYLEKSMTATALAEKCEEDKATISRAIDYLERNGFLVAQPKDGKRYKTPLCLTQKGEETGKKIAREIEQAIAEMDAKVPKEDLTVFYHTLLTISEHLDAFGKRYNHFCNGGQEDSL